MQPSSIPKMRLHAEQVSTQPTISVKQANISLSLLLDAASARKEEIESYCSLFRDDENDEDQEKAPNPQKYDCPRKFRINSENHKFQLP